MGEIEVLVAGKRLTGWSSAEITRTIQAATSSFQLTMAGRPALWDISSEDIVSILVDGEPVVTGHIDGVSGVRARKRNDASVAGRGLVADLVDCAARMISSTPPAIEYTSARVWRNADPREVIEQIASGYDVTVDWRAGELTRLPKTEAKIGDTCWTAIERILRRRGLLGFESAAGELVITTPTEDDRAGVVLESGRYLSARSTVDHSGRFRFYRVFGQLSPWAALFPDVASKSQGDAIDESVRSPRTRVIVAEGGADSFTALERAKWEASVAATRGSLAIIRVRGWREQPGGRLWEPNRLVGVNIPELGLDGERMILTVTYTKDEGGEVAELEVGRGSALRAVEVQENGWEGLFNAPR